MPNYLTKKLIRANWGKAYYTDNGIVKELLTAKSIEAKIEVETDKILELGKRTYSHIPGAIEVKGTLELYWCSDYFLQRYLAYAKGGAPDIAFTLQIQSGDVIDNTVATGVGKHLVTIHGVLLTTVLVGKLGTDTNYITASSDFVADSVELTSGFTTREDTI